MSDTVRRLLQRQVLPLDGDHEVFPLYVDLAEANLDEDKYVVGGSRAAQELNNTAIRQGVAAASQLRPEQILDRTRLRVDAGQQLSLGSYFNGFPASYWRRWTIVDRVRLEVSVEGAGAAEVGQPLPHWPVQCRRRPRRAQGPVLVVVGAGGLQVLLEPLVGH